MMVQTIMTQPISMLDERLTLLQPDEGLRTTSDAVFLAAACPIKTNESVLDLGCGVGSAGLCLLARIVNIHLTGIDIQTNHLELAERNASMNGFSNHVKFLNHDIREKFNPRFDHVICNPPYLEAGTHIPSPSSIKATAKGNANLEDWVRAAHQSLKSKGSFTLIHRADYMDRIIRTLGKKFGRIEIIPLWPKAGHDAKRIIIRCIKDSKSPAILRSGLILHEQDDYTGAAKAILRDGAPL